MSDKEKIVLKNKTFKYARLTEERKEQDENGKAGIRIFGITKDEADMLRSTLDAKSTKSLQKIKLEEDGTYSMEAGTQKPEYVTVVHGNKKALTEDERNKVGNGSKGHVRLTVFDATVKNKTMNFLGLDALIITDLVVFEGSTDLSGFDDDCFNEDEAGDIFEVDESDDLDDDIPF